MRGYICSAVPAYQFSLIHKTHIHWISNSTTVHCCTYIAVFPRKHYIHLLMFELSNCQNISRFQYSLFTFLFCHWSLLRVISYPSLMFTPCYILFLMLNACVIIALDVHCIRWPHMVWGFTSWFSWEDSIRVPETHFSCFFHSYIRIIIKSFIIYQTGKYFLQLHSSRGRDFQSREQKN